MTSKNIAVIGSGIAGLTCAHFLSRQHKVTVFEKNDYIGGHTATVDVELAGQTYAIDTGFIVFNDRTYPNFLALLDSLNVGKRESEMSFSVNNTKSGLQYNGHSINSLFAQRSNLISPKFWGLIREILRFNRLCKEQLELGAIGPHTNVGEFLQQQGFSEFFAEHYILPMGAAIWSTSIAGMKQFPLKFFVDFFNHHGLLNVADRPQWYVIPGGSRGYIGALIKPFKDNIRLNSDIINVSRPNGKVILHCGDGSEQHFDEVVFACHSDQALALLGEPSDMERKVLGQLHYGENEVVLHTDSRLLPSNKRAWASWNYLLDNASQSPVSVTYNMNILQGIQSPQTFCVTLNQTKQIDPTKILRQFRYAHPQYTIESNRARLQRKLICGKNHSHFVGAYWYNGFHEDGVKSGLDVAKRFGCFDGWENEASQ